MPDTKITALTALTAADPANDVLPIVDVSDTTMAASGTTKKISINNVLGASGTATLASATITGDLTVATSLLKTDSANTRVGIGTNVPSYTTHIRTLSPVLAIQDNTSAAAGVGGIINFLGYTSGTSGANVFGQVKGVKTSASVGGELQFFTSDSAGNSVQRYLIDSTGVSTWSVAGSTAMTLNSTGLGVGTSPSYKFHVKSDLSELYFRDNGTASELLINSETGGRSALYFGDVADIVRGGIVYESTTDLLEIRGYNNAARLQIDSVGNVVSNVTGTAPTLSINSQMVFNLTSNTNLRISVRGTDGVTRTANITLA